jgi:hypothetical protein
LEKTDYFELKSTQQLHGWPFVHSDDSTVVLNINVKEEGRIGQKTAPPHCHWCLAADSIDDGLLRLFELLLGTRSSLLWPML